MIGWRRDGSGHGTLSLLPTLCAALALAMLAVSLQAGVTAAADGVIGLNVAVEIVLLILLLLVITAISVMLCYRRKALCFKRTNAPFAGNNTVGMEANPLSAIGGGRQIPAVSPYHAPSMGSRNDIMPESMEDPYENPADMSMNMPDVVHVNNPAFSDNALKKQHFNETIDLDTLENPDDPLPRRPTLSLVRESDLATWDDAKVFAWFEGIGVSQSALRGLSGQDLLAMERNDFLSHGVTPAQVNVILKEKKRLLAQLSRVETETDTTDDFVAHDGSSAHNATGVDSRMDSKLGKILRDTNSTRFSSILVEKGITSVEQLSMFTTTELSGFGINFANANRLIAASKPSRKFRQSVSDYNRELKKAQQTLQAHMMSTQPIKLKKKKSNGGSWIVDRDAVFWLDMVGEGAFGEVYRGTIPADPDDEDDEVHAAIKMLKGDATQVTRRDFLDEIRVMQQVEKHPHVVNLLGYCIEKDPFLMFTQFMEDGDLHAYLYERRPDDPSEAPIVKAPELLQYMVDIASGLEYLASKRCVHRDVAARNILLQDKRAAVADFGLARNMTAEYAYFEKKVRALPIRWLSPEALAYRTFTTASDVWAFGITLWEIVMMGATPYPGYRHETITERLINSQAVRFVMGKPHNCSDDLYAVMDACWQPAAEDRPSFTELVHLLEELQRAADDHVLHNLSASIYLSFDENAVADDDDDDEAGAKGKSEEERVEGRDGRSLQRSRAFDQNTLKRRKRMLNAASSVVLAGEASFQFIDGDEGDLEDYVNKGQLGIGKRALGNSPATNASHNAQPAPQEDEMYVDMDKTRFDRTKLSSAPQGRNSSNGGINSNGGNDDDMYLPMNHQEMQERRRGLRRQEERTEPAVDINVDEDYVNKTKLNSLLHTERQGGQDPNDFNNFVDPNATNEDPYYESPENFNRPSFTSSTAPGHDAVVDVTPVSQLPVQRPDADNTVEMYGSTGDAYGHDAVEMYGSPMTSTFARPQADDTVEMYGTTGQGDDAVEMYGEVSDASSAARQFPPPSAPTDMYEDLGSINPDFQYNADTAGVEEDMYVDADQAQSFRRASQPMRPEASTDMYVVADADGHAKPSQHQRPLKQPESHRRSVNEFIGFDEGNANDLGGNNANDGEVEEWNAIYGRTESFKRCEPELNDVSDRDGYLPTESLLPDDDVGADEKKDDGGEDNRSNSSSVAFSPAQTSPLPDGYLTTEAMTELSQAQIELRDPATIPISGADREMNDIDLDAIAEAAKADLSDDDLGELKDTTVPNYATQENVVDDLAPAFHDDDANGAEEQPPPLAPKQRDAPKDSRNDKPAYEFVRLSQSKPRTASDASSTPTKRSSLVPPSPNEPNINVIGAYDDAVDGTMPTEAPPPRRPSPQPRSTSPPKQIAVPPTRQHQQQQQQQQVGLPQRPVGRKPPRKYSDAATSPAAPQQQPPVRPTAHGRQLRASQSPGAPLSSHAAVTNNTAHLHRPQRDRPQLRSRSPNRARPVSEQPPPRPVQQPPARLVQSTRRTARNIVLEAMNTADSDVEEGPPPSLPPKRSANNSQASYQRPQRNRPTQRQQPPQQQPPQQQQQQQQRQQPRQRNESPPPPIVPRRQNNF